MNDSVRSTERCGRLVCKLCYLKFLALRMAKQPLTLKSGEVAVRSSIFIIHSSTVHVSVTAVSHKILSLMSHHSNVRLMEIPTHN